MKSSKGHLFFDSKSNCKTMKKHSILLGLFVLSFAGLAQTPSAESLMASYPFTNGSLNNAVGDDLHGIAMGEPIPVEDRFGNPNSALHFGAAADFIQVPGSGNAQSLPFTVSLWFAADSSSTNPSLTPLFKKYSPATWNGIQVGHRRTADGHDRVVPWYLRSISRRVIGEYGLPVFDWVDTEPASQAWHHVVFAVDSIGGRLYVDGDLQAETPWDGEPGSPTTNYLWQFAGSYEWADTLLGYQGALDDIAVWSEALSTEEVEELYEEQYTEPLNNACTGMNSYSYNGVDYSLVDIAGTCWFKENLATATYVNGDSIPYVAEGPSWPSYSQGRRCLFNDSLELLEETGYMYNFNAVSDARGLCPTGWSVPAPEQFEAAVEAFGSANQAFRTADTWDVELLGEGTDDSGFSGKGYGERGHTGTDGNWGSVTTFWSDHSPLNQSGERWILGHSLYYPFQSFWHLKSRGAYIRCTADSGTFVVDTGWDCEDLTIVADQPVDSLCAGDTVTFSLNFPEPMELAAAWSNGATGLEMTMIVTENQTVEATAILSDGTSCTAALDVSLNCPVVPVLGCTDASACNYNSAANVSDDSCVYAAVGEDCEGGAFICGSGTMWNSATQECECASVGLITCPTDVNGDGSVGVSDLMIVLGDFGSMCD